MFANRNTSLVFPNHLCKGTESFQRMQVYRHLISIINICLLNSFLLNFFSFLARMRNRERKLFYSILFYSILYSAFFHIFSSLSVFFFRFCIKISYIIEVNSCFCQHFTHSSNLQKWYKQLNFNSLTPFRKTMIVLFFR